MQFELKRFWSYLNEDFKSNFWWILGVVIFCSFYGYINHFTQNIMGNSTLILASHISTEPILSISEYYQYIIIASGCTILSLRYIINRKREVDPINLVFPVSTLEKVISIFIIIGILIPFIEWFLLELFIFNLNTYYVFENTLVMNFIDLSSSNLLSNYIYGIFKIFGFGSILLLFKRGNSFLIFYIIFQCQVLSLWPWTVKKLCYYLYDSNQDQYDNIYLPSQSDYNYYLIPISITGLLLIYHIVSNRELKTIK